MEPNEATYLFKEFERVENSIASLEEMLSSIVISKVEAPQIAKRLRSSAQRINSLHLALEFAS